SPRRCSPTSRRNTDATGPTGSSSRACSPCGAPLCLRSPALPASRPPAPLSPSPSPRPCGTAGSRSSSPRWAPTSRPSWPRSPGSTGCLAPPPSGSPYLSSWHCCAGSGADSGAPSDDRERDRHLRNPVSAPPVLSRGVRRRHGDPPLRPRPALGPAARGGARGRLGARRPVGRRVGRGRRPAAARRHDPQPRQTDDRARRLRAVSVQPQPPLRRPGRAVPGRDAARQLAVAAACVPRRDRAGADPGDRPRGGVPRGEVRRRLPGLPGPRAAVALAGDVERAFALEAGSSAHSVENYARDIRRLADYAASRGGRRPEDVTTAQLREFVYALKDLGLAPATIRRQVSAVRTYYRFLIGEGRVARDPSERLESPRQWRTLPAVLTHAEV